MVDVTPYQSEGTYTSESREVAVSETWDTWANPQSMDGVEIVSGSIQLAEMTGPPDPGDLHSRYDFSEEDGSLPVTDQSGNGNDLGDGGYTSVNATINGNQAGEFDGADDIVTATGLSSIGPPFHEFYVIEPTGSLSSDYLYHTDTHPSIRNQSGSDTWAIRPSGNDATVSGNGQNPVVIEILWDSSETTVWINETGATDTVNDAASSRSRYYLGGRGGYGFFQGYIGEVLRYGVSKDASRGDIHSYLSDKWGPF